MRMTVRTLRRHSNDVLWAEIHAVEGQSYLVILELDGERRLLCNNQGGTLSFTSLAGANDLLARHRVAQRDLVHQSAYNEMIGLDESAIDPLRLQTGRRN